MATSSGPLRRTALRDIHAQLGGRLVDFGGWELPVQYTGVLDEHVACRTAIGLFDVSHMGEFLLEGPGSTAFLNQVVTNDVSKLAVGQAQYSAMCNEQAGIVDDLVLYRRGPEHYLIVVNASNTDKDFAHFKKLQMLLAPKADFKLDNQSSQYSQIAIQGPRAAELVQKFSSIPLSGIKIYWFAEGFFEAGAETVPTIFARTGYTGEDGFEVYIPWESAPIVWTALMETGRPLGLKPCGLGARDTLRLEMKYPLYGQELTDQTSPLEAGLGWVTKPAKGPFFGSEALKARGAPMRALVGFEMLERAIPRTGYAILDESGNIIGEVTSGTLSPSTQKPIGIGYVPVAHRAIGSKLWVQVRDNRIPALVVGTPFYKKG